MAEWQGYLSQARKFWEVAEAVNDPEHTSQAASNAILAVIAANDAVCLRLAGRKPGGESHTAAAEILREAFKVSDREGEAAQQARRLLDLIKEKNEAQYRGKAFPPEQAARIMKQAQRFMEWIEEVFAEIGPDSPGGKR